MTSFDLLLCDLQGQIFEDSVKKQYSSKEFVQKFMNSDIASYLDSKYNRYQWAGKEYILDEFLGNNEVIRNNDTYSLDTLYWIGYIYRYWHYFKNEESRKIYKIANFETMVRNYYAFHSLSPEHTIENLIEIYEQNKGKK